MAAGGLLAALAVRHATGRSANDQGAGEQGPSEKHPCAEGLDPLVDDACYAAPAGATSSLPLLIYLHGFFEEGPGEGQNEALDQQRRVALRATARGFAVLALRGTQGACAISAENATKVCWPSNEKVAYKGAEFVREWQPALAAAAARHAIDKQYIFGFSNGGYFAGLIAVRALYDADAFAIAHAGPVEPVKALGAKPPLLLLSADEDLSQESMLRFDEELTHDEWPHENHARGGGHALPDSDIEVALTFFQRTRTESLPLRPPLGTHVPRPREPPKDLARVELDAASAPGSPAATANAGPSDSGVAQVEPDSF